MAEFAGYYMPISYQGILEEHHNVRNHVGVFDVSHMGEFIVKGKEAEQFLQAVTTNDVSKLKPGDIQYSCLPNKDGGIVDDLLVYRLAEDMCSEGEQAYMLVVNASNMSKDWDWLQAENRFEARMSDISDRTGLLAVQGPRAVEALQELTDLDLAGMKYYSFRKGRFAGIDNVLVSATGYTGAGGFELYVDADRTADLWDAVFEAGKAFNIQPAGLGCRDTLRLEMGYCLYGNDIDDTTSPLEAGLGWITKLQKGPFNSSEIFQQQKQAGVVRKLVGFEVNDRRVPRHGYTICDADGNEIGEVTSGTMSPSLERPIGMGYVETVHASPGSIIRIEAGKKHLEAVVTGLPFIRKPS